MKLDFNKDLDHLDGDFKSVLVNILRNSDSAKDAMEAATLEKLVQEIAYSDEGIEVTQNALDVLEKNVNRIMQDEGSSIPNVISGAIGQIIQEGRGKLDGDN